MRINAREIARGLRLEGVQNRGREAVPGFADLGRPPGGPRRRAAAASRAESTPAAFSLRDLAANTIFSRDGEPVGHSFVEEYFDPANARPLAGGHGGRRCLGLRRHHRPVAHQPRAGRLHAEEFVVSKLVPTMPTRLNGERIPGVALPRDPGEDFVEAEEMDPLHYVGFTEEYVETPATVKRQFGIAVTKEAIFFDRTGLVLDRASYVGTLLGLRKEKNLHRRADRSREHLPGKADRRFGRRGLKTPTMRRDGRRPLGQPPRRQPAGRLDEHQRRRAAVCAR